MYYSWELGHLTLILALAASDRLILLHGQQVPPYVTVSPPPIPSSSSNYGVIVAILFISTIMVALCAVFYICRDRGAGDNKPRRTQCSQRQPVQMQSLGENYYSTSESNKLGEGGFGTVYKGVLHDVNNQNVAIKKLKAGATQGKQEFLTEVEVINLARHRNVVSLVGYCIGKDEVDLEAMMLVYEYIPNNSLYYHLHGTGTETIEWKERMRVAIGSAMGLAYLHEDCKHKIIHRDIKSANVLLHDDFEPKIADFGLAKRSSDTVTHVTTSMKGTFGYVAPEYASTGRLTEKADVFSFGVMLLELITGRKPAPNNLVEWARPLLSTALGNRNFEVLADPKLHNTYNPEEMFRMASCAANCVRRSADRRPRMHEVVDALEGKIRLDNGEVSPQVDNEHLKELRERALGRVSGSSSH